VLRIVHEAWDAITETACRIFGKSPLGQNGVDVGKPLAEVGLFFAASSNVVELIDRDAGGHVRAFGFVTLVVGLLLWGSGRRSLRQRGRAAGVVVTDARATAAVHEAIRGLPPVLDCNDRQAVAAEAARATHPLIGRLLHELATWRPRAWYDDEREYHEKLFALLKRQIPEASPLYEEWIRSTQESGRVDIILSTMLIEIKAHPNASAVDRLIGQAWKYLRIWQQRGPLVLVLCRTDPQFAPRLRDDVLIMRQNGYAVLAVLAAP
jgi:hypothetical protein